MMLQEPLWTSSEVDMALGSLTDRPWYADGVQIDSRKVFPGDLFVALTGSVTDGHRYVLDAFERGAVAAVVSDVNMSSAHVSDRLVMVPDTRHALGTLARVARNRAPAQLIGVTGSAGKTSVVQALKGALSPSGPTHSSVESYNNHVGVPLSLARMPRQVRYGVFELGMSGAGEISNLSRLVKPDVAVITTVGPAHIEHFDSVADIARAKAEILAHVAPGGTAILGIDHDHADILQAAARAAGVRVVTVSARSPHADVHVTSLSRQATVSCLTANINGMPITYRIGQPGDTWVLNSLLILAAVQAVGADVGHAALTLANIEAEPGRGRIHTLTLADGEATLIDDSYNANPISMNAAFKRLALMEPGADGRRLAVLADMRELGFDARARHESLAPALRAADVDRVYALGGHVAALTAMAGVKLQEVAAMKGLAERLMRTLREGDLLMVKGSNGAGLGALVSDMLDLSAANGVAAGNLTRRVVGRD